MLRTPTRFFTSLPNELCLAAVLRSGQSFRWKQHTEEWSFGWRDRTIVLSQTLRGIHYYAAYNKCSRQAYEKDLSDNTTWDFLRRYFATEIKLSDLYSHWLAVDPNFGKQTAKGTRFNGLRVLRQDPFEALICFISSSNNNIGRITLMIDRLCTALGQPLPAHGGVEKFSFPTPEQLASEDIEDLLRELGFGYRAPYIQRSAALLLDLAAEDKRSPSEYLDKLKTLPYDEARQILLQFVGVGPKVADCIALFGLGFDHIVPVDTHIYQIAVRDYGFKGAKDAKGPVSLAVYEKVQERLRQVWGERAGWAQQILFAADLRSFASFTDPLTQPKTEATTAESLLNSLPIKVEELLEPALDLDTGVSVKAEQITLPESANLSDRVKGRKRKATVIEFKSVKAPRIKLNAKSEKQY